MKPDLLELVARAGGCSVDYADPVFPDRSLRLHSARPERFDANTPVLFVHHGVARNGRDYRDYWAELVDTAGVLAISLEFPEATFPEYLWYNFGNLHDAAGVANPREQWSFGIVPRLFDALRTQGVTACERYGLFGHSAGGQFVHRMLSPSAPMPAPTRCRPWKPRGPSAWVKPSSMMAGCVRCSHFPSP